MPRNNQLYTHASSSVSISAFRRYKSKKQPQMALISFDSNPIQSIVVTYFLSSHNWVIGVMSGTGDSSAVNGGGGEIMLFGVRVVVDSMRKSVSLNNLSQYEQPQVNSSNCNNNNNNNNNKDDVPAAGYASADDAVHNNSSRASRERKRGSIQISLISNINNHKI